jgi:hypothetical protein
MPREALNQSFDGNGKTTGNYTYNAHTVWHSNSMGEHVSGQVTKYEIGDYGRPTGDFRQAVKGENAREVANWPRATGLPGTALWPGPD